MEVVDTVHNAAIWAGWMGAQSVLTVQEYSPSINQRWTRDTAPDLYLVHHTWRAAGSSHCCPCSYSNTRKTTNGFALKYYHSEKVSRYSAHSSTTTTTTTSWALLFWSFPTKPQSTEKSGTPSSPLPRAPRWTHSWCQGPGGEGKTTKNQGSGQVEQGNDIVG